MVKSKVVSKIDIKYLAGLFLLVYVIALCWVLFISVGHTNRSTYYINPDDHLMPFQSSSAIIKNASKYNFRGQPGYAMVSNIFGNLILFFPWGVLSPLVFNKLNNIKWFAALAILISLSVELIQHFFSIGIFDTDDIIYNSTGAIAGFYFLKACRSILNLSGNHHVKSPLTFNSKKLTRYL
jgi:glycopeptide antibiotics resistance protein